MRWGSSGAAALVGAAVAALGVTGAPAYGSPVYAVSPGIVRLALVEYGCSYWSGGHDSSGADVVLTAGHCANAFPLGTRAYFGLRTQPSGTLVARRYVPGGIDFAAIRLDAGSRAAPSTVAAAPAIGDSVCKVGRMSGRTCGIVTRVDKYTIHVDGMRVVIGDSGGPLKNARGAVVGLASGADAKANGPETYLRVGGSMAGLTAPVPAVFARADKIVEALRASIGFTTN